MSDDARRSLAAEQRRLLAALAGGPVPPGFDAARLALAGRTLLNKRRRGVERRWPALAATPGFAGRFEAYARLHPLTADDGPTADGAGLCRVLLAAGELSDDARWEWARHRAGRGGVAVVRLAGGWAVAVRVPFGRVVAFHVRDWHRSPDG